MSISAEYREKFGSAFEQLLPVDGKLDGGKCREALMKSDLSTETLGRIWDLSDIDCDGCLDKEEFILAMYLTKCCLDGGLLPDRLPPSLIPTGKEAYLLRSPFESSAPDPFSQISSPTSLAMISTDQAPSILSPSSNLSPSLTPLSPAVHSIVPYTHPLVSTYPPWVISADELSKSDKIFATIDLDVDGLISGVEARDVLLRSGLQQSLLAQLWDLVDVQQSGYLNNEQFAVALYLITQLLSGSPYTRALPPALPPELYPPSLRPSLPDQALFEESNRLIAEIEKIVRERATVEAECTSLTSEIQQRATETANFQRRLDTLNHTSRSLVTQRTEAERRLSTYAHEREILESHLKDLQSHVYRERRKVEDMRTEMNNQQLSAKSQEESINSLRNELNESIREETSLQDRLAQSVRRLEAVKTESETTQHNIDETTTRITNLESTRGQLLQSIEQFSAWSNGDSMVSKPDDIVISQLLSTCSIHLADDPMSTPINTLPRKTVHSALDNLDWMTVVNGRSGSGACSVPLDVMSDSQLSSPPISKPSFGRDQTASALAWPTHTQTDRFAPGADAFRSLRMSNRGVEPDDPFGQSISLSNSDPFKDTDIFGGDLFATPTGNTSDTQAFDPFCPNSKPITPQLTGADFDAVFGRPDADENSRDHFGDDPFSSLEQKANRNQPLPVVKKSPPPRPKFPAHVGKSSGNRKTQWDKDHVSTHNRRKLGSLPDVSGSLNNSKTDSARSTTSSTGHGTGKFHLLSKARHTGACRRSSKGSGSDGFSNSPVKHSPDWFIPSQLNEEQQLTIATMESERLAQMEERVRKQEADDLELAIRLSRMESGASP